MKTQKIDTKKKFKLVRWMRRYHGETFSCLIHESEKEARHANAPTQGEKRYGRVIKVIIHEA